MKNINEINEILCEQIDLIRDKKTTPKEVNAICNLTATLLRNVKMQIEYAKLSGKQPEIKLLENAEVVQPA